jgi:hypothetical protein
MPDTHELLSKFAATISGEPLRVAERAPEPWAQPMNSIGNVLQKRQSNGGHALFGWAFLERESSQYGAYLVAVHHAIWIAEGSTVGVDITPLHQDPKYQPYCPGGKLLFLLDATALPKKIGSALAPLPSRFFAATEDPALAAYVESLNSEEQAHFRRLEGSLS